MKNWIKIMCLSAILCAIAAAGNAQVVTGTIFDENGDPVSSAAVQNLRTNQGVISGADGTYRIAASTGDTLYFTSVGFTPVTVKVSSGRQNMVLQPDDGNLSDVVVVGYGTVKKTDLTGSVADVPITDMQKAPVRSFVEALGGRVAGVAVASSDGQPGASNQITIRGNNSITQDNSPLYVVDGFPIEGLNSNGINPNDIESVSVLKDASATAIYGARGANGVIVITTKSGKAGPPVVNLSASYGIQKTTNTVKLMSPYEFVRYQLEISPGTDTTIVGSAAYYYLRKGATLESYRDSIDINWQSRLFRTAPMKDFNLSVSGGNAQTKYSLSGNILDQDGVIINSGYKRYQGRFVINQNLGKRLKANVNVNYSRLEQYGVSPFASSGSATSTLMYSVWGYKPFGNDLISQPFDDNVSSTNDYRFNPILNQQNAVRKNNYNNLSANAFIEYAITKELKLKVSGGIDSRIRQVQTFNDTLTSYGNPRLSTNGINGSVIYYHNNSWLNENTLSYNKRFNKNHNLNAVAGFTMQEASSSVYGSAANNLPPQATGVSWLSSGTPTTVTSTASVNGLVSFLGRVNYTLYSDYLLTASFRADGSSKFSPENHWSYFPSAAFAWKLKNNVLKNVNVISDGKLRISYGLTGNNRVGDFPYLSQYSISTISQGYTFGNLGMPGLIPDALGNIDLKWETTEQWDLGLDLSFINNRINLTADIYKKVTKDLLLNANIPTSYGYRTIFQNIGSVENRGLEITVNTFNIKKKDFTWNTSFNISFNANKVLSLANNQHSFFAAAPFDNTVASISAFLVEIGKPLGLMYGPIWDGVYQYDDFDKSPAGVYTLKGNIPTNGNVRSSIQPGDIKYKDLNGDGVVNNNDFTVIGRGFPLNTGGLTNNFSYKGFDLSVFFQWSYGNDILNANRLIFEGNGLAKQGLNQFDSYKDRWTPENPSNTLFRTRGQGPASNIFSSRVIEDGSYLRLKTVSFGYNIPAQAMRKWGIKNLNVYVAAQNLFTWTNYTGNDPEVSIYNSVLTPGVDYSAYPRSNTTTFGLKATL